MALIIPATNGMHVDTKYSAICEPNLYSNAWLVPGVTCTDKYQIGGAGQIMIHKLAHSPLTPGAPGRDFTHVAQEDAEIPIVLNNNYQTSRKLYQVALNAISAPIAEESLAGATQDARMGMEQSGLACLYTEAGETVTAAKATKTDIKDAILETRGKLSKKYANGGVILASPDAYTALMQAAGAEFTPNANELVRTTGRVGNYYGMIVFEVNALASGTASTYYNAAGTLVSVTAANMQKTQFIMYDADAFSVVKSLEAFRMADGGKDFIGALAQVEMNVGMRLTTPERAIKVVSST